MRKYSKHDQRLLAIWAVACANRVLPLFEGVTADDDRPRDALTAGRAWIRTGVFRMPIIRAASLSAHAAARAVKANDAACFAARAAGQAVATAHVPQHAYGAALYALKAVAAADPAHAETRAARERAWQERHLPVRLRRHVMNRLVIEKRGTKLCFTLRKGPGF